MAPLLLDTPVLLWWLTDDRRLAWTTRNRIARPSEAVFVSVATAWEISSLARQGVVDFGAPVAEWLPHARAGRSIEDCIQRALAGMDDHVLLLRQQLLPVPPENPNPQPLTATD